MIDLAVDTTAIIDILRGHRRPSLILQEFFHPAASHVVIGELLLGTLKATQVQERERVLGALEGFSILSGDSTTANIYARVRWQLESTGNSIPQNDVWIASSAIQYGLPLLTRDQHFARVSGLKVLTYNL